MSRQNKVNPGMYTQRGRLSQDDAAREIAKQRSIGSEHTWQPVQRDQEPRVTPESEGDEEDAAVTAPDESTETPARATAKRAAAKRGVAKKTAARKTAKAPARRTVGAKKIATPAMRGKAKTGRTAQAKAKSAKRRKS
jgi:hypothetical protein